MPIGTCIVDLSSWGGGWSLQRAASQVCRQGPYTLFGPGLNRPRRSPAPASSPSHRLHRAPRTTAATLMRAGRPETAYPARPMTVAALPARPAAATQAGTCRARTVAMAAATAGQSMERGRPGEAMAAAAAAALAGATGGTQQARCLRRRQATAAAARASATTQAQAGRTSCARILGGAVHEKGLGEDRGLLAIARLWGLRCKSG
jgi:hypothetical protein